MKNWGNIPPIDLYPLNFAFFFLCMLFFCTSSCATFTNGYSVPFSHLFFTPYVFLISKHKSSIFSILARKNKNLFCCKKICSYMNISVFMHHHLLFISNSSMMLGEHHATYTRQQFTFVILPIENTLVCGLYTFSPYG